MLGSSTVDVARRPRRALAASRRQWPFWAVYADAMTGLFAVMLALFALSYWWVSATFSVSAERFEQIQLIEEAVRRLADNRYFVYQPEHKRHVLQQGVQFNRGSAVIPARERTFLTEAGRRLESLINDLKNKDLANVKYLVVIEGMASNDGYASNFELSYQRALALYRLWREMGISFDPEICEVVVAGSGTGGVGRYGADEEFRNQRILIQIWPKVG